MLTALGLLGGATGALFITNRLAASRRWFRPTGVPALDAQATYQLLGLGISGLVLVVLRLLRPDSFHEYVRLGSLGAPAIGVAWMGIAEGEPWTRVGPSLMVFITIATTVAMRVGAQRPGATRPRPWLWILLFSVTNACLEEVIYRCGAIVPLAGALPPETILMVSAIAFGAPHLRGLPSGLGGALMSGVLGWVLAKSVLETQGLFWAWSIHALQDVVIFAAVSRTWTVEAALHEGHETVGDN